MQNSKKTSILKKGTPKINEFAFARGFSQVQNKDVAAVRKEIMTSLKIKTAPSFLLRLRGKIEPKISEVRIIEEIFAKRGITDVWGEALEPITSK
jgi:hypothetical protein